jgi:anti-anti-sigma regulatory factor
METSTERNIVCDVPKPGVRVVRFIRPDLRPHLYDRGEIMDCSLYREIDDALTGLAAGETVIVNFGLVDWFPTAFYRLQLALREAVLARSARLVLCCFTPNVREGFELMGGPKVFETSTAEAKAVHEAGAAR